MRVSRTNHTGFELMKHEESQASYALFLLCIHLAISRPFFAQVWQCLRLVNVMVQLYRHLELSLLDQRLYFSLCFCFCYWVAFTNPALLKVKQLDCQLVIALMGWVSALYLYLFSLGNSSFWSVLWYCRSSLQQKQLDTKKCLA